MDNFERRFNATRNFNFLVFALVFVLIIGGIIVNGFLSYQCYMSNDVKSAACFMIGEKATLRLVQ